MMFLNKRIASHNVTRLLVVILFIGLTSTVQAGKFRVVIPITSPQSPAATIPENAIPVVKVYPVPRSLVEQRLREILKKWNTPHMAETLAAEFYDRSRLLDAVDSVVPRDATLRIQSLQGIQTLQQYRLPAANNGAGKEVSIVSATVRTQLEFNGPASIELLPGTNEFILKFTRPVLERASSE